MGPVWREEEAEAADRLLASCYRESLRLAAAANCQSIAFPSISTGIFGYPFERACRIALETIRETLREAPAIAEVRLVCFSAEDHARYRNLFAAD